MLRGRAPYATISDQRRRTVVRRLSATVREAVTDVQAEISQEEGRHTGFSALPDLEHAKTGVLNSVTC